MAGAKAGGIPYKLLHLFVPNFQKLREVLRLVWKIYKTLLFEKLVMVIMFVWVLTLGSLVLLIKLLVLRTLSIIYLTYLFDLWKATLILVGIRIGFIASLALNMLLWFVPFRLLVLINWIFAIGLQLLMAVFLLGRFVKIVLSQMLLNLLLTRVGHIGGNFLYLQD